MSSFVFSGSMGTWSMKQNPHWYWNSISFQGLFQPWDIIGHKHTILSSQSSRASWLSITSPYETLGYFACGFPTGNCLVFLNKRLAGQRQNLTKSNGVPEIHALGISSSHLRSNLILVVKQPGEWIDTGMPIRPYIEVSL